MNVLKTTVSTLVGASVIGFAGHASAVVIFDLDDTSDLSLSHTDAAPDASPPNAGSADVENGVFSWGQLSTDGSANVASFTDDGFASSDWGGLGTFASDAIDVSGFASADIAGVFSGLFNTGTEFSNFFYQLDDAAAVTFGAGLEDEAADDVAVSVSALDLTGISSLVVGFQYSHNGGSDFFEVSALTVTGTPIPEPASLALVALGGVALMGRRRTA